VKNGSEGASEQAAPKLDTTVPHSARVWNYWLGGKDNFAVDRLVGDQVREVFPAIVEEAQISRAFLGRAVRYLVEEAGVRQFLDVGTGLPTADNTHQIAQRSAPEARIVYVDNDPLVLTHARALLTSTPEGRTQYIDAELRDVETIVSEAGKTLDFDQPIALILSGIMGHVADQSDARAIVERLVSALPSGSYLVLSDGADVDEAAKESMRQYGESGAVPYTLRTPDQIREFFNGLELVDPGFGVITRWRPQSAEDADRPSGGYAAVGRKP
jgi:S-adenosyl methyltransferase